MSFQEKHISLLLLALSLIISNFFSTIPLSAQQKKWELKKNQNGVKIYIKKHEESGLKEILGITTVNATLGTVVATIKDTPNHKNWMYSVIDVKLLESDDFEWILHSESEAPWPIKNRELIVRSKMQQDLSSCNILIKGKAIPDYLPEGKTNVRIQEMESSWLLTPTTENKVEITLKMRINLGGNLPIWLTNMVVDKGPFNTLSKLKATINNKEEKTLSYIKNSCQ